MTGRQRFLDIADGRLRGEVYLPYNLNYGWFMDETLERWRGEGLPADADVAEHFGLDRVRFAGGAPYSLVPPFERVVLAQDQSTLTIRDEKGATLRVLKEQGQTKMPQWLDYPVKTREDFRALARRLDAASPERYPGDWDVFALSMAESPWPVGFAPGSFYGHTLQQWVGTERLCMLFYDDPSFVHEMLEYLEEFFLQLARAYLAHVSFDFASFGEDIAYKGRSFPYPAMFREFLQPRYVAICDLMRRSGIRTIFVDSDGFIDELIGLWMEVGINGFSPLEIAAGTDPQALKRRYGEDIVLAGGIDKRALLRDERAIDAEIAKVRALLEEGRYFPAVDHSVPQDVPYRNFAYLVEGIKGL